MTTTAWYQYIVLVGGGRAFTSRSASPPSGSWTEDVDNYDDNSNFLSYFARYNPEGAAGSYGPYSATSSNIQTEHRAGWLLALTNPS